MSTQQLKEIRHIALDMDGTIYSGGTLFPFTRPFLARLEELGIGYTFFTNHSSKSVRDYISHMARFGMQVGSDHMYTSTLSTIAYLRRQYSNSDPILVVGTTYMQRE